MTTPDKKPDPLSEGELEAAKRLRTFTDFIRYGRGVEQAANEAYKPLTEDTMPSVVGKLCADIFEFIGTDMLTTGKQPIERDAPFPPQRGPPDDGVREKVAATIIDHMSGGNETLATCSAPRRMDALECANAILALLDQPPARVPAGWKFVPEEPTEAMERVGYETSVRVRPGTASEIYRAMIAAAPAHPDMATDALPTIKEEG